MSQKVPPLEDSKAIILKTKGPAWLKEAEAKFQKQYGNSVKDPATRMWLIGKQAGLSVAEIKPSSGGGEGSEVTIVELQEKVKKCKSKNLKDEEGWTEVRGGVFDRPDPQAKYGVRVCVLSMEEGLTSTDKPKYDMVVTDGTGVVKMVANGDAVGKLAEVNAGPGVMLHLPLVNVQYGTHNFSQEKDKVWWKLSLPPFGDVNPVDLDPKEMFPDMDSDVPKEGKPGYFVGFIASLEPSEQEVCLVCKRWVMDSKPNDHDRCKEDDKFETETRTTFRGAGTSVNGQTYPLTFVTKPKVKMAEDMVEIYGKVGGNSVIDVAFIRKAGTTTNVASSPAPAAVPTKAKKVTKPTSKAPEPEEQGADGSEETEKIDETPPAPPPKPKPAGKKPVPPPPPAEGPEEPQEEQEQAGEAPEEAQGPEEAPVVVRAATKTPVAAKAPAAPAKAAAKAPPAEPEEAVEDVEIPDGLQDWLLTHLPQFGGKQRIFVLTRNALGAEVMESSGDFEEDKKFLTKVCTKLVAEGHLEWTSPLKNEVRVI